MYGSVALERFTPPALPILILDSVDPGLQADESDHESDECSL